MVKFDDPEGAAAEKWAAVEAAYSDLQDQAELEELREAKERTAEAAIRALVEYEKALAA